MPKHRIPFFLAVAGLLAIGLWLLLFPQSVSAQCGSSASSCKSCHEVLGKDPVNIKGAWHTAHAFGDFCEFCHAGNVKAKDEAGAHTGLISPLADPKGSCQSCHPNDYMDRAQKYADALGKPLGAGAPSGGSTPGATGTMTTTAAANTSCGPAPASGGQVIDLTTVYAGMTLPSPSNIGNWILLALIGGTALLLLGLVWHYEKPLPRLVAYSRALLATPVVATTPEGMQFKVPAEMARRPEYSALEHALAHSDPATVRAVTQLLSDRENGPKLVKALSHMDLQTLAALGESDQKALAALLALAKEINS
ncbi:MAG: hypothetical protein WCF84_23070 [Anaerolineae bacterium]